MTIFELWQINLTMYNIYIYIYVGSRFSDWAHGWVGSRPNGPITMNFVESELKSWALTGQRFV